jgi:hypothetical protein
VPASLSRRISRGEPLSYIIVAVRLSPLAGTVTAYTSTSLEPQIESDA